MLPLHPLLRWSARVAALPFAVYTVFVGLATIPIVQRQLLYAHKISSIWWTDLNIPEAWGFAKNQVTPFEVNTPDGETIYAWHVMPLPLYLQHEATVAMQESWLVRDFTTTESFRLLKGDPKAKLILNFHGNAGHIAQANRPNLYHTLTDTSSYHLISIDYRGFGYSTGVPSENGLITDAEALVEWAVNVAGITPDRIVLLGQSLGTAVVSGVAERYALRGVEFAGLVLVAGFGDLATALSGYRFRGIIPALGPFASWPSLINFLDRFLVDKWHSANRLGNIVRHTRKRLRLSLVHAKNDRDIPWTEDNKLFKAAVNESLGLLDDEAFEDWKEHQTLRTSDDAFVTTWRADPDILVRQELFPYGHHNEVLGFAPVVLAVMRSFDLEGTVYNQ